MTNWQFALLGGAGGATVEILALFYSVIQWQTNRKTTKGRLKAHPPKLRRYVDPYAASVVLILRVALGAFVAWLFGYTGQITGAVAAVALGFAAPMVLKELGANSDVQAMVKGVPSALPTANAMEGRLIDNDDSEASA